MTANLTLDVERFRLTEDGRKWRSVCEQRVSLAIRLAIYTKSNIVYARVPRLIQGLGLTRRTFFRRMDDLKKLRLLRSIGRMGYEFNLPRLQEEFSANLALSTTSED